MGFPLISVIIPTYNRRPFLKKALDSVFLQTKPCHEILIIDDGSTDGTEQFVREYSVNSQQPLRYLYQENKGAASARNLGIKNASGNILCFLDSDDYFLPEKIELQKKTLDESGLLISHTEEKWLRRGQHLNKKQKHHPPDGHIFADCLPMCVVGMSTVMVRRELFDSCGLFDESLPCCEDYDLWLRVSSREKFKLVPKQLTVKNGGRADQLSVIHRVGMDKYRIKALVNLLDNTELSDDQYRLALNALRKKCRIYGEGCLKHGRFGEGMRYLRIPERYDGK